MIASLSLCEERLTRTGNTHSRKPNDVSATAADVGPSTQHGAVLGKAAPITRSEQMAIELDTQALVEGPDRDSTANPHGLSIADGVEVVKRQVDVILSLHEALGNGAYAAKELLCQATRSSYGGTLSERRVRPCQEMSDWLTNQADAHLCVATVNRWKGSEMQSILKESLDELAQQGHRIEAVADDQAAQIGVLEAQADALTKELEAERASKLVLTPEMVADVGLTEESDA